MQGPLGTRIQKGCTYEGTERQVLQIIPTSQRAARPQGPVGIDNIADNIDGAPAMPWVHRELSAALG